MEWRRGKGRAGREGNGRKGKVKGRGKRREGRGRTPHCFLDKSNVRERQRSGWNNFPFTPLTKHDVLENQFTKIYNF